MADDDLAGALFAGVGRAALLRQYCFGLRPGQDGRMWDPVYPHHHAPRRCPFCGRIYRRHGGFADHRDRCGEGPNPGANPAASPDRNTSMEGSDGE